VMPEARIRGDLSFIPQMEVERSAISKSATALAFI